MPNVALLSHPLFLLVVGAILSRLFIPWITRRWQHTQKELELKTELVADISEAVMKTVMTVRLARTAQAIGQQAVDPSNQEQELNRTYKEWVVDSCIIGSKIHAYFPEEAKCEEQIHKKWGRFSDRLGMYVQKSLHRQGPNNEGEFEKEKDQLLEQKARIIKEVLDSKITGLYSRTVP